MSVVLYSTYCKRVVALWVTALTGDQIVLCSEISESTEEAEEAEEEEIHLSFEMRSLM